jgi:hypothetical protein
MQPMRKVTLRPENQGQYNNSGQDQSYMPQQPMKKPTLRPGYGYQQQYNNSGQGQYNNSGQTQSYMPQQPIAKKTARPIMGLRPQGYEGNSGDYNPSQVQTKIPPPILSYQPSESTDSALAFALPLFNKIFTAITNPVIPTLNNVLSSVGEPTITVKKPTKGGAKKPVAKKPVAKKTVKKTAAPAMKEQLTAISNNIMSQLSVLQKGIKTVGTHLPCESSDSSGPTEGGSRVKKSKKTRRNRRS